MIIGKTNIDYFVILCEKCGSTTKNEYLGTDPMMPRFKATCPKCGDLGAFKLDAIDWSGLPPEPSTSWPEDEKGEWSIPPSAQGEEVLAAWHGGVTW
jgi:hypothetical protein